MDFDWSAPLGDLRQEWWRDSVLEASQDCEKKSTPQLPSASVLTDQVLKRVNSVVDVVAGKKYIYALVCLTASESAIFN